MLHRTLRYKGAKAAPDSEDPDVALDFCADRALASLPKDSRHVDTTEHGDIEVWKTSDRMVLRREETTVDIHPNTGTAKGAIDPDLPTVHAHRRRSPLFYLITISLAVLLRHRGWFPLHAAGLSRSGRGVLFPAGSGRGKSTAALDLVQSGWQCLSDDSVLLRSGDDEIRAYSYRPDFCVDPGMEAHFPELESPEWPPSLSDSSKWQVDTDRIYPGQSIPSCTPRLVVLPEIADAAESSVEPVAAKPALEALIGQGAFLLTPDPSVADRHLTLLRHLLDQSRTYRLHAGRDVLETSDALHDMLAPLLEGATP